MTSRFYYDGITLDRAHHLRINDDWLDGQLTGRKARVIPVWRDKSLIIGIAGADADNTNAINPKAAILNGDVANYLRDHSETSIFLGIEGDTSYFAVDLSHHDDPNLLDLPDNFTFEDLRRLATSLDPIEAGYLAYARALVHWHRGHQFCGVCGTKTIVGRGGHERACPNTDCGKVHFPRTDPAVIMLVTHPTEEKCLLGHNKKFQGLRFSTIAGFVEPGEMLEQAVAREVYEETNIEVVDVAYKASQPWPFPASIMLGFRAHAVNTEIICHDEELAEARWFSRDEVKEMAASHEALPPSNLSISRWLIDSWLYEK